MSVDFGNRTTSHTGEYRDSRSVPVNSNTATEAGFEHETVGILGEVVISVIDISLETGTTTLPCPNEEIVVPVLVEIRKPHVDPAVPALFEREVVEYNLPIIVSNLYAIDRRSRDQVICDGCGFDWTRVTVERCIVVEKCGVNDTVLTPHSRRICTVFQTSYAKLSRIFAMC